MKELDVSKYPMIDNEDYAYWGKLGAGAGGTKFTKESYVARYRQYNYNIVDSIIHYYGKPKKVLSLGCGLGLDVERFVALGIDVIGLEIASHMVNNSSVKDRIVKGSATDLSIFTDNEFDLIVALELIEHIPPELTYQTINEIRRVGSNRTVLTIGRSKADPTHINLRPRNEWEKLLSPIDYSLQQNISSSLKKKRLVDAVWDRVYVMELS